MKNIGIGVQIYLIKQENSMKTRLENKSNRTKERIETIKISLKAHKKNIKLLQKTANGRMKLPAFEKQARVVNYNAIGRSEVIRRLTLKNLTDQVSTLNIELVTLLEYGA
jgi:hypothetical protein